MVSAWISGLIKKNTVPHDGSCEELYLDSTLTGDSRSRTTTQKRKIPEERRAGEGSHMSSWYQLSKMGSLWIRELQKTAPEFISALTSRSWMWFCGMQCRQALNDYKCAYLSIFKAMGCVNIRVWHRWTLGNDSNLLWTSKIQRDQALTYLHNTIKHLKMSLYLDSRIMQVQYPWIDVNKYFDFYSMSDTVLGTRYSASDNVHNRTGYLICKAQCKGKCRTHCSRWQQNNIKPSRGFFWVGDSVWLYRLHAYKTAPIDMFSILIMYTI